MKPDTSRAEVRSWLERHAQRHTDDADYVIEGGTVCLAGAKQFQRACWEAGYVARSWPVAYGGQGLDDGVQQLFDEEAAQFDLDNGPFLIGLRMVGPTILALGTEEQKTRYLPPLLAGDEVWCQLFSEPSAGSDLANLQTTAVRTADGWLLNGQKVWTSGAQVSDFGAILARTDPSRPKHRGITMFVVDMRSAGVTVKPLVVATGDAPFNEVYFDDVLVPADAVIGEIDQGWSAALVTLRNEREALGTGAHPQTNPLGFEQLSRLARARERGTSKKVRDDLSTLYARELALHAYGRLLREEMLSGADIGALGSVAKLSIAEIGLWASDLAADIIGTDLAAGAPDVRRTRQAILIAPGFATGGGSNEIQRNIIAERVMGLPKGPSIDRDVPFNELRRTL